MLLHVHVTVRMHPLPCPWSIYGLADDFVQCFAHTEVGTTVAPLKLYPTSLNGLQRDWVKLQLKFGSLLPQNSFKVHKYLAAARPELS